jgi:hypothetical protein
MESVISRVMQNDDLRRERNGPGNIRTYSIRTVMLFQNADASKQEHLISTRPKRGEKNGSMEGPPQFKRCRDY